MGTPEQDRLLAEIYADLIDLDDNPQGLSTSDLMTDPQYRAVARRIADKYLRENGLPPWTLPDDPLGYDTSDFMSYARRVAQDALAGKDEDAVQEEVDRLSRLFPAAGRFASRTCPKTTSPASRLPKSSRCRTTPSTCSTVCCAAAGRPKPSTW